MTEGQAKAVISALRSLLKNNINWRNYPSWEDYMLHTYINLLAAKVKRRGTVP